MTMGAEISQRATTGQGVAMGLQNSFSSLGRAFGPLWAAAVYDVRQELPFLGGALFQAIALTVPLSAMRAAQASGAMEE